MEKHMHVMITCNYCWNLIPLSHYGQHIVVECQLAPIKCYLGCGEYFCRNQMEQHYKQCGSKGDNQNLLQDHQFVVNCTAIEETSKT